MCMYVYIYICLYVGILCRYVCMYVCMYVCILFKHSRCVVLEWGSGEPHTQTVSKSLSAKAARTLSL